MAGRSHRPGAGREADLRRLRDLLRSAMAAGYDLQRAGVDALYAALYAVREARYADPALRFRADARIVDWSS
ncbi:hypothetical protein AB0K18_31950 [Nonomuraea sp. NPDC049421]|uniref:hypothetical protein n=1 Tax=Nonomuraea sp. NPDC049421 TaxID=3155275 RepID=UPI00344188FA